MLILGFDYVNWFSRMKISKSQAQCIILVAYVHLKFLFLTQTIRVIEISDFLKEN